MWRRPPPRRKHFVGLPTHALPLYRARIRPAPTSRNCHSGSRRPSGPTLRETPGTCKPVGIRQPHCALPTSAPLSDTTTADRVRIQYGGSVKAENAGALMSQPDIDGALVGGASLDPRSFAQIVQAAANE